jgi:RNA polymerase sigma-70 factor (ECF subfamily)
MELAHPRVPAPWGRPVGLVWGAIRRTAPGAPGRAESERLSQEPIRAVVERARRGDPQAFAELFERYQLDVSRVCRRMLGRGPAAEDAVGEVFLRARRGIETCDPARPFRPWLLSIAGHHCVDQLRRRATELRLFEERDFQDADLLHPGPSPLKQVLRAQEQAALLDAIDALEPRYRLPLVLRYFSDLDYAAIAETLGVSAGQVGTLLFRAKRRLRETLSREGPA